MQNPAQFKIPAWFLNRQKDITDGKDAHVVSNQIDQKMREDLERLKKIRCHRGLRHFWGLKVKGRECTRHKDVQEECYRKRCACFKTVAEIYFFFPVALDPSRSCRHLGLQSTPRPPVDDATSDPLPRSKQTVYDFLKCSGGSSQQDRGEVVYDMALFLSQSSSFSLKAITSERGDREGHVARERPSAFDPGMQIDW